MSTNRVEDAAKQRSRRPIDGHRTVVAIGLATMLGMGHVVAARAAGPASQAAREFDRAAAAAAQGDYLEAAAAFMRAYKLAPHASTLYNAGLAWEAAGDRPRAADAYASAIDPGGLAGESQAEARRRLAALEAKLGRIDVVGAAGTQVSVAHADRLELPARIHVECGDYVLRAWFADGRSEVKRLTVGLGQVQIRLEAPAVAASAAPTASFEPPKPQPSGANTLRTLGWVAAGTGAVIGGVAAYLGVQALDARNQYYDSGRMDRDAYDRAGSYRLWTNVALASAVIIGGTGVVLLIQSRNRDGSVGAASSKRPGIWMGAGPGALSVGGRF